MFILPLIMFGFALATLASPTQPQEGLLIKLSVPTSKVESIQDVVVTATVTNAGSKKARVFKHGTVIDDSPTQSFVVTKDGKEVAFRGIKVQVDTQRATDEDYVVIQPGGSFSVVHKIAEVYDFESAGIGSFTFTPAINTPVTEVPSQLNAVLYSSIGAPPNSVSVEVTASVKSTQLHKRAVVTCSNPNRAAFIRASYTEAKELARSASTFISRNNGSPLYKAYWKTNRAVSVVSVFNAAAAENSKARKMGCVDTVGGCRGRTIAYTFVAPPQNIVFCPLFFTQVPIKQLCSGTPVNARNTRGATTLHELTHAVANTNDVAYGCPLNQSLSAANQLRNADNYNCFATQAYKNTRCK